MAMLGYFFTIAVLMVLATIASGYVLSCLWGWFVVPFFKVPELTIAQAIGLGLIISLLTNKVESETNEENIKDLFTKITGMAYNGSIKLITLLFMGWVVHFFV